MYISVSNINSSQWFPLLSKVMTMAWRSLLNTCHLYISTQKLNTMWGEGVELFEGTCMYILKKNMLEKYIYLSYQKREKKKYTIV
jgi:hypothetical protein